MSGYNIILDTDSYKASHWLQYPPGTTSMFSYIESRGGKYDETVFFGLQYYLRKHLCVPVNMRMVNEAAAFYEGHGVPFNRDGWEHIVKEHGGNLPLKIRAVPEGSIIPIRNVLVTVESTDPKVPWLVSWVETMLMRIWHPINVATIGYHVKKDIMKFLEETSDDPEAEIPFKLHDFGSRGVSSQESAAIGGAAHLVNFQGSDTVVGIVAANKYYNHKMAGFSIPASEHSTMTAWGKENEVEAYRNMLRQYGREGSILACVSDSYDIIHACRELWGGELRQEVIDSGATVVVRPDSGDPVAVIMACLWTLGDKFGVTENSKGYRVLNNVRVIQGDGIGPEDIHEILTTMKSEGWSATNIAFGMGSGLLQKHNRDTQKMAMKCSSITVNGEERDVWKEPMGDKSKSSKRGRLDLVRTEGGEYLTISTSKHVGLIANKTASNIGCLEQVLTTVFKNGSELPGRQTLEDIRKRVARG